MGDSDHATPNLGGITGPYDQNSLLIYGGGGHGKSIIDLIRLIGKYKIVGIVDDGLQSGEQILGCAVLGDDTILEELFSKGLRLSVNAVGGVGDIRHREVLLHWCSPLPVSFTSVWALSADRSPTESVRAGSLSLVWPLSVSVCCCRVLRQLSGIYI